MNFGIHRIYQQGRYMRILTFNGKVVGDKNGRLRINRMEFRHVELLLLMRMCIMDEQRSTLHYTIYKK
jgi:hypothetical protein